MKFKKQLLTVRDTLLVLLPEEHNISNQILI